MHMTDRCVLADYSQQVHLLHALLVAKWVYSILAGSKTAAPRGFFAVTLDEWKTPMSF